MSQQIFDISIPITIDTIVYPGNPAINIEEIVGDSSTYSKITMGTHSGTHIDAPRHVFKDGGGTDMFQLSQMTGPAIVVDCTHVTDCITIRDLENVSIEKGSRILLKTTNSVRGYTIFYDDFIALDGDCADWLAEKGVSLVGIDYLSIKKRGGSDHRAHTALLSKNIVILEGIDLSHVEAGEYTLVCLPLKLIGLDGAPVRAVLLGL